MIEPCTFIFINNSFINTICIFAVCKYFTKKSIKSRESISYNTGLLDFVPRYSGCGRQGTRGYLLILCGFFLQLAKGRAEDLRETRRKRTNLLASYRSVDSVLLIRARFLHGARRQNQILRRDSRGSLSSSPVRGKGTRGRNDGILVLEVARVEFLPVRGKKKRRHASSASDLNYRAARKNGSTRVENLSARVDREIYGVAMPE